ncbi:MAG: hypothetical protein IT426_16060 [Pirellulales bacterium]|nr:hypothetical protein [Pirellulales bacterium]
MQSKQSSGTVFLRAVVMLGSLGVIFYAALSGNALPDAARKQIEKYLPRMLVEGKSKSEGAEASKAAGEAPLFNIAAANQTAIGGNAAPRKLAADGSASRLPALTVGGVSPARAADDAAAVVPASYQAPAENAPGAANAFSQIQDRLKQLGATYYLLETWGNRQQFYRFYCKMAVAGNTDFTHCFEATDADPLQAMADVLKQVEAWRNGGLAAR